MVVSNEAPLLVSCTTDSKALNPEFITTAPAGKAAINPPERAPKPPENQGTENQGTVL